MVHLIQIEEEPFQITPASDLAAEGDPLAETKLNIQSYEFILEENTTLSQADEIRSHQAMDEEEIDHEMLNDAIKFEPVNKIH